MKTRFMWNRQMNVLIKNEYLHFKNSERLLISGIVGFSFN